MKNIFRIVILLSVCFFNITLIFGVKSVHAQDWERVGWKNKSILVHAQLGNTLYGTDEKAFYRSQDLGKTWSLFNDGLSNNALFQWITVRQDYLFIRDNNTVYFCRESDDKWQHEKLTLLPSENVRFLYWSPDTILIQRLVYIGSEMIDSGFHLSTDRGLTWNKKPHPAGVFEEAFPGQGQTVFGEFLTEDTAKHTNQYSLFRTEDLGNTWEKLPSPTPDTLRQTIFCFAGNNLVRFAIRSGKYLYRFFSSDNGRSWFMIKDIPSSAHPTICKQIGAKIFLGFYSNTFENLLYESSDTGFHWNEIPISAEHPYIANFFGKEDSLIIYEGLPSGIDRYYIIDTLHNVIDSFSSYQALSTNPILAVSGKKLFIPFSEGNSDSYTDSLMVSTDNGDTWNLQIITDGNLFNQLPWICSGNKMYATGKIKNSEAPCLFTSSDQGNSWKIRFVFDSTIYSNISKCYGEGDSLLLIIETYTERLLYISIDGGLSWVVKPKTFDFQYFHGPFLAGLDHNLFISSKNLGGTWDSIYIGNKIISENYLVYALNSTWLLQGISGNKLFYSTDNGMNIMQTLGIEDSYDKFYPYYSEGMLFMVVANYNDISTSVFRSSDEGKNWIQIGNSFVGSPYGFVRKFFSGSEYYFVQYSNQLWRYTKSAVTLSTPTINKSSTISISCFPNPATTETRISYSLPKRGDVLLRAFDMTGKLAATIASETDDGGSYEVLWNTRSLPSGSYVIELSACGESVSKVVEVSR